eukprot:jgi/Ulvmu1/1333/UM011_0061.1
MSKARVTIAFRPERMQACMCWCCDGRSRVCALQFGGPGWQYAQRDAKTRRMPPRNKSRRQGVNGRMPCMSTCCVTCACPIVRSSQNPVGAAIRCGTVSWKHGKRRQN